MTRSTFAMMFGLWLLVVSSATRGQSLGSCNQWIAGPLTDQQTVLNGAITCSTIYTAPDGVPLLVIGGNFTQVAGMALNRLAAWDGASWRGFGSGANSLVSALHVHNGELYVGGSFTAVNGVAANGIAKFDGATWQPLGSGLQQSASINSCNALFSFNGHLIVAGRFGSANGVPCKNVARYDGTTFHDMGGGLYSGTPQNDFISALTVYNNTLYAGGTFTIAGTASVSNIAYFDGTNWHPIAGPGSGANAPVSSLSTYSGQLVAGGLFTTISGVSLQRIARFNGSTWTGFGSGFPTGAVRSFQAYNGWLFAGGSIGEGIRAWNGSSWLSLGGGVTGGGESVDAMAVFQNSLITCGSFTLVGPLTAGIGVSNIARWNTTTTNNWSQVEQPFPNVFAMASFGGGVVAAGDLLQSTISHPATDLVRFNGSSLTRLAGAIGGGEGTNGNVQTLKSYTTIGINGGRSLVVGGDFTSAGGVAANNIALYREPNFDVANWSAMGSGFNGSVLAIERHNNVIYAGGTFTASGATTVNRIAQWTGTAWVAMGTGMNGSVFALRSYNGVLFAGGLFTTAGGVSTGGLAYWNGTNWAAAGSSFSGTVRALEVHDNHLVIGGQFTGLAGAPNIVRYFGPGSGQYYQALSGWGTNSTVRALKAMGSNLYIGGSFTTFGLNGTGTTTNHIAKWSIGGWQTVDQGVNGQVYALELFGTEVHAGGVMGAIAGGGPTSPGYARFLTTTSPMITSHPFNVTTSCGEPVIFYVQIASGYPDITFTWQKNGANLSNGPTGYGSIISGANTSALQIENLRAADAGSYACIVSNSCGNPTSNAATLTLENCCTPDINGDNQVGVPDLLAVISQWGVCAAPPNPCPADIAPSGGDGQVGVPDLLGVISGWGPCR